MGVDKPAVMARDSATLEGSTAERGVGASKVVSMDLVMAVGQLVVERWVAVLAGLMGVESMAEAPMAEVWTAVNPAEALVGAA